MPGKYSVNGYDGRLDHVFNANHRIFGRVTQKNITSSGTDGTAATGALGSTGDTSYNPLMGTFTTTTGRHQPGRLLQLGHPAEPDERTAGRVDARELQLQLSAGAARQLDHFGNWASPACPARPRTGWAACPFSTSGTCWAAPRTNTGTRA